VVDVWPHWFGQIGFGTQRNPLHGSHRIWRAGRPLDAVAGCYTTTLRAIAGSAQFDFTDLQVEASGTVRKADSGYSFTQIVVRPNLKIASAEERDRALDLLKRAEKLCLVSRALGTNLKFEPQLEIVKPASIS
jgi:uncharacterized OsmC-like protein